MDAKEQAAKLAESLYDQWELKWRHNDHVFYIPDAASDDMLGLIAAALVEAEQHDDPSASEMPVLRQDR